MGDTMEYLLAEFPAEPEQWGGTFDDVGAFWLAGLICDDYDGPLSEGEAIQWRSARQRLRVAMIPEACHGRNLRTLRPADWQDAGDADGLPPDCDFRRDIPPGLQAHSVAALARATGLTPGYCSFVRRGLRVPHRRHWETLSVIARDNQCE